MKTKKIPLRKCLADGQQYPKKELLRIVKTPSGEIIIDTTGKQNGRGAYLKLSAENIALLKKTKALNRALQTEIPEEIYLRLTEMLEKEPERR